MIDFTKVFRTPYTTMPHFEVYGDELFDLRTNLDKYIEREFEWTVRSNKSYFTDRLDKVATVSHAVCKLGLSKHLMVGECYSKDPLLRRLGVLLQEDIAILENGMLTNYYIAFPTNWNPLDKKFKSLAEIHCPVAHSEDLVKASDKICDKLANSEKNYHRYAWTITHDDRYCHHPDVVKSKFDSSPYTIMANTFVRIEHQKTFPIRKDCFGFLIDVTVVPMLKLDHGSKNMLFQSLKTVPESIADYKGIRKHREILLNRKY